MAAPAFVQKSSLYASDDGLNSPLTVTVPSGLTNGNILFLVAGKITQFGSLNIDVSSYGFVYIEASSNQNYDIFYVYARYIDGNEPASYTVATTSTTPVISQLYEYSGIWMLPWKSSMSLRYPVYYKAGFSAGYPRTGTTQYLPAVPYCIPYSAAIHVLFFRSTANLAATDIIASATNSNIDSISIDSQEIKVADNNVASLGFAIINAVNNEILWNSGTITTILNYNIISCYCVAMFPPTENLENFKKKRMGSLSFTLGTLKTERKLQINEQEDYTLPNNH